MTITRLVYAKESRKWLMYTKEFSGKYHRVMISGKTAIALLEANFICFNNFHFEEYRFVKTRSVTDKVKIECEGIRKIISCRA